MSALCVRCIFAKCAYTPRNSMHQLFSFFSEHEPGGAHIWCPQTTKIVCRVCFQKIFLPQRADQRAPTQKNIPMCTPYMQTLIQARLMGVFRLIPTVPFIHEPNLHVDLWISAHFLFYINIGPIWGNMGLGNLAREILLGAMGRAHGFRPMCPGKISQARSSR